ncbi:MAG: DUF3467 domain-containing protein [Candidatus Spechtbacterales bacterium]|nr:DUF3467 domain-containing protein [Candidatus Spechtbacterales bacterium]
MAESSNQKPSQQPHAQASEDALKGRYANAVQVFHGNEEFILEFLFMDPHRAAHLLDRIILSPRHMKRLYAAIGENLKKYEDHHGEIKLHKHENENK